MITLNPSGVVFRSEDHTYWLDGRQLVGITSTLITRAFPDKYKGIDPEVLANAARRGTEVHEAIAFADRFGADESAPACVRNYLKVKEEHGLTTIENEYLVTDTEKYATAIDLVMTNERGEVCLIDTKTTYTLDKLSTALQLSINRRFFERQNPKLKVAHIYALWLPKRDETIAQLTELSPFDDDTLNALFKAEEENEPFELYTTPEEYPDIEAELRKWVAVQQEAEAQIGAIRERLMALLVKTNLPQIKSGYYTVSYIPAKTSTKFDSAAFKKAHADLYNEFQKQTESKATICLRPHKQ